MSYSFDAANDRMTGTFTTSYALPIAIAAFVKTTAHPVAVQRFASIGSSGASVNDSIDLRAHSADDVWRCVCTDSGGVAQPASITITLDAATIGTTYNATSGWVAIVGIVRANNDRQIYVGTTSNTGTDVNSITISSALNDIKFGEAFSNSNDFAGNLAELAIWNVDISATSTLASYMSGIRATSCANMPVGYWALSSSNATQSNDGSDATGDLSVSGATFAADHPTITVPSGFTNVLTGPFMGPFRGPF